MTLADFLLRQIQDDENSAVALQTNQIESDDVYRQTQRTLAKCDAERRIVDLHSGESEWCGWTHDSTTSHDEIGEPCETLRLLALPYADHDDWREEWRP